MRYRCYGLRADGVADWRDVEAATVSAAAASLLDAGWTPLDIRAGGPSLIERLNRPVDWGGALNRSERALFIEQLSVLLEAGMTVDRSLELLMRQPMRAGSRSLFARVLDRVRAGVGLGDALAPERPFPPYVIGVVRAAERGGTLVGALRALGDSLRRAEAVRGAMGAALTYPAIVLGMSLVALGIVLTVVVPQFEPMFEGEEARLPTITRVVLAMSRVVNEHARALAIGLALLGTLALVVARSEAGAAWLRARRAHLPGMALRDRYIAAAVIGTLGTLIGNGVPLVEAVRLAADATGSRTWHRYLGEVERMLRGGARPAAAFAADGLMPELALRLIEVGERSSDLSGMCARASGLLGDAARAQVDRLVALANPIAIVVLGGLVAMLVLGVMLGIFALGSFVR